MKSLRGRQRPEPGMNNILTSFEECSIFVAVDTVAKIGLSLKLNHHNCITKLNLVNYVEIRYTHCRLIEFFIMFNLSKTLKMTRYSHDKKESKIMFYKKNVTIGTERGQNYQKFRYVIYGRPLISLFISF